MAGFESFADRSFHRDDAARFGGRLVAIGCLAAAFVAALVLMALPVKLSMGAFYWDLYLFQDAAARIDAGQLAHRDFFLPVGALPYHLHALGSALFAEGHPLLVAQFSMLVFTIPLMAAAVAASDRSPAFLLAATLPFAIFALLPVNTIEFHAAAGFDGSGIYNRQSALILYALVFTLFAVPRGHAVGAIAGLALALLFFVKINGFIVGVGFVALAGLSGRLGYRSLVTLSAAALAPVIAAEMWSGVVSRYLADIHAMLSHNESAVMGRVRWLVGAKFDVIAAMSALVLLLAWFRRRDLWRAAMALVGKPGVPSVITFVREPAVQLAGAFVLGLLFELQNTGSHEFIYIWPVLLALFPLLVMDGDRIRAIILSGAIALAMAPTLTKTLHRAAEAVAAIPMGSEFALPQLDPLDRAVARPEVIARARQMLAHYGENVDFNTGLAELGLEPASLYYATPDFQALLLFELADAVDALQRYEARTGRRFESMAGLDFVDVLPLVMKRKPVDGIVMGLDPARGFPVGHREAYRRGLSEVEAILQPLCPVTPQRLELAKIVEPVLAGRTMIQLSPCWRLYVRNDNATAAAGE